MKVRIVLDITGSFEDEEIECFKDNYTDNLLVSVNAKWQLINLVKNKINENNTEISVDNYQENQVKKWPKYYAEMGLKP